MALTIGKRVIGGFGLLLALTGGIGVFSVIQLRGIDKNAHSLAEDALPSVVVASAIESTSKDGYGYMLNHIISDTPDEMTEFENRIKESGGQAVEQTQKYKTMITSDVDRKIVDDMEAAQSAYRESRDRVIALSRALKTKEAFDLVKKETRGHFNRYQEQAQKLAKFNVELGDKGGAEIIAASASAINGVMIGLGVALLVGVVAAALIVRGVNKALTRIANTLGEGSTQVASASTQVSAGSQSLAQGASEQAAALEESTSALEEMSSMTKKNSETAIQARALANDTQAAASKGNEAMAKMSTAINDIQKSATETSKILKTIDEIAFQTNLLALNAAVEAARAGEAGKGFAVVAEEVRNLAMRSAEAAKNTATMIEGSVQNARNGVAIVTEVGSSLAEITEASQKVNNLVGEIAAASQEQSQGIGQINTAVSQMDKVTQESAANAEESAAAAEELSSQAEQLQGVVGELVALVGGSAQAASREPARKVNKAKAPTTAHKAPVRIKPKSSSAEAAIPFGDDGDFNEFSKAA
ncbi:MAG TPA: methyl-accepting chemotaxis protein [Tepidisphaeraceae bacterium]|jgi:methyl-accepting chemotaxis protein|nr:methyl-accepting chemotaxis protein [Tepidisphaeraceae bacterium]